MKHKTFVPVRPRNGRPDNRDYNLRGEQFRTLRQENQRRFAACVVKSSA